jgi:hypothetical protein
MDNRQMSRRSGNNEKRKCIEISPSQKNRTDELKNITDKQTIKKVRLQDDMQTNGDIKDESTFRHARLNQDASFSKSGSSKSDDGDTSKNKQKEGGHYLQNGANDLEMVISSQKQGNYGQEFDEITSDISSSSYGSRSSCTFPVPRVIRIRKRKNNPVENGNLRFLQGATRRTILALSCMLFQQAALNAILVYFMIKNKGDT